ncbi:MAG TPA: restriction endonuclease [Spirillospora sp.]|nr:restriction endonuclease [Spirillospora sp.]
MESPDSRKKIAPLAYNALAEALSLIFWYKKSLGRFLRAALREYPELLAGLDLENAPKRETADVLVSRLMENEAKYQSVSISLMIQISTMENFRELEQLEDLNWLERAQSAVADLNELTAKHREIAEEHARFAQELADAVEEAERGRAISKALDQLKQDFAVLHSYENPQERGRKFEGFINELFSLFDLNPRAAYSLELEQIDGSFSFDTDDYVLEAKWLKGVVSREQLDVFKSKIERKGKNALGLYVSINGYSSDALKQYESSSSFITMDGSDIYLILDGRVRLDDLLLRKKRHVNETGNCYFPAVKMLGE